MKQTNRQKAGMVGFTLVELVVTVAIIGILAAIAIPSYRTYIVRTNRADAQKTLLAAAQAIERYYIANNTYVACTAPCTPDKLGTANTKSPESGNAVYNITLDEASVSKYVLLAKPTSGGVNSKDGCLRIDNTGLRGWSGAQATAGACGTTYDKAWTDR